MQNVKLYFRISRPVEINVLKEESEHYDGIIAELHMFLVFKKALTSLLTDVGKRFSIDPIVYRLAYQNIMTVTSQKSWFEEFLLTIDPESKLIGDDLTLDWDYITKEENIKKLVKNTLSYERGIVEEMNRLKDSLLGLLRYLPSSTKKEEVTLELEYLIPPYLIVEDDKTLDLNISFSREAINFTKENETLLIPLVFSRDYFIEYSFDESQLKELVMKFEDFSNRSFLVWITAFDEYEEDSDILRNYILFLKLLRKELSAERIVSAYSTYFSDMLAGLGYLDDVIHGVGVIESRDPLTMFGRAKDRYYMPIMHQFLSPDKAEYLRNNNPTLFSCDCGICSEDKPIIKMTQQELLKHFIRVKNKELRNIKASKKTLEAEIQQLEEISQEHEIRRNTPILHVIKILEKWRNIVGEL